MCWKSTQSEQPRDSPSEKPARPAAWVPTPASPDCAGVPGAVLPSLPAGLRGPDTVRGLVWLSGTRPSPQLCPSSTLLRPCQASLPRGCVPGAGSPLGGPSWEGGRSMAGILPVGMSPPKVPARIF